MDEALRRLERGDDPLAYAAALRRAGNEVRARRVVEASVRAGAAGAREVLDAWWPVDQRVLRVVARAMQPDQFTARVLTWLVAEEDPRLAPVIDSLIAHWAERFGQHPSADHARVAEFVALLRSPFDERRRIAIGGINVMRLSRARLDAEEAATLLRRPEVESARQSPAFLLCAIWHAGRARAVDCTTVLRRHAAGNDRLVASEATRALHALGVDAPSIKPGAKFLSGSPFRPSWVVDRCPGEIRDTRTGALERSAFVDDPLAPLDSDETDEVRVLQGWLMSIRRGPRLDVRGDQEFADAQLIRALHASLGDRVGYWGRQEWLIRLEPELDARSIAEGLCHLAIGAAGVTISIGIARGSTWAASSRAASSASALAEQEGGDRVRVAL